MHTHTHLTLTLTPSLPHPDHSRLDTLVLRMARHALRVRTAIPVGILSRCIEHLLVFRPFFVHLFEILWTFQHNTVHVCIHSNLRWSCCRVYMPLAATGLLIWMATPVASQTFDLDVNGGEVSE